MGVGLGEEMVLLICCGCDYLGPAAGFGVDWVEGCGVYQVEEVDGSLVW